MKRMKRLVFPLFLLAVLFGIGVGCEENVFSKDVDERVFEYVLRDSDKMDIVIHSVDSYYKENEYFYHIKYSCTVDGAAENWDVVYLARKYGSVSMHYNLNWEDSSVVFPMKDSFYDAVDYGVHTFYTEEEIDQSTGRYYEKQT